MKDKIIIGGGIYGLYAAIQLKNQGNNVIILECEDAIFKRASYINQARVHMGYHYPRSISTAMKSRGYFDRFINDYGFCINNQFEQIYATSNNYSWTSAEQFYKFCKDASIRCDDIAPTNYFNDGMCDGAFKTTEYAYDATILGAYLLSEVKSSPNISIRYEAIIAQIEKKRTSYRISLDNGYQFETDFLINATYAGVNQIHAMMNIEPLKIKYELCEIILCRVNDSLKNIGLTIMDGPFFSIMPFGKTGIHSLTSVTFTPHLTSFDALPTFNCQKKCKKGYCSPTHLGNCNNCQAKPKSAWSYMSNLASKYIRDKYQFEYVDSLYSIKPILMASEIDDSRPTVIRKYSSKPTFISVLSGKINTIYDLDEVLEYGYE